MDDETLSALALARVPGVGPQAWQRLMAAFGSATDALTAGRSALLAIGLPAETVNRLGAPDWAGAEADAGWVAARPEHHLLRVGDPGYPCQLAEIPDPPPLLFLRGTPEALHHPQVALVGSRHATAGGTDLTRHLAGSLAEAGLTVTSGLAYGIDGAAHRGALDAGGTTIAVTATGVDRPYPRRHRRLHEAIAEGGAVVSEQPPGTEPAAALFPRRNRIISGLARGVVVVQAGRRSGALITARQAAEQGREVFAVPGSVHDPAARGCHALLREGATLVEHAGDVLDEIGWGCPAAAAPPSQAAAGAETDEPEERQVLEALGHEPLTLDALRQRSGLTLDRLSSILLTMELKGLLTAVPGGRYQRRKPEG